jgi:hypothetical protein
MISIFLGAVGGVLQIGGYILYAKKITAGRVKPNAASWGIWTFGAALETASYIGVTGDWVKNILPIICALSAIIFFFYCLHRGYFGKVDNFEKIIVVLDIFAIFIWWLFESAVYANFLLIATAIISFIPIIRHVWKDPMVEDTRPWLLWTTAYTILLVVVILRYEKWEDLVYPIVFIPLHLIVGILALDSRAKKRLLS